MNWKWVAGVAAAGILAGGMWMSRSAQARATKPSLVVTTQDNQIVFMQSERYASCVVVTKRADPAGK